jgi:hypothetical protein
MKTQLSKAPKQIVSRELREPISTTGPENRAAAPEAASASGGDEIELLAYRYWQERGCPIGCPEDDWYRAERELASRSKTVQ